MAKIKEKSDAASPGRSLNATDVKKLKKLHTQKCIACNLNATDVRVLKKLHPQNTLRTI